MRRILTSTLVLGLFSAVGLIGCGEESKVTEEKTISTPTGEATISKETKVETSGSNPPATTGTTPATTP